MLTILSDRQGHIMTEIADFAMIPAPTLTKLMDRMVSAGLDVPFMARLRGPGHYLPSLDTGHRWRLVPD